MTPPSPSRRLPSEGHQGLDPPAHRRGRLAAGHEAAFRARAGAAVRLRAHDGAPRAARAGRRGSDRAPPGLGLLRRAAAPDLQRAAGATSTRRSPSAAMCTSRACWRSSARRRSPTSPRRCACARAARSITCVWCTWKRRAHPARRPARQPGAGARLHGARLHAGHALGGAVRARAADRGRAGGRGRGGRRRTGARARRGGGARRS